MKRIAIIPARGNSKRLPRKNILDFCGKPMLIWTCEAALQSGLFHTILVSTEDPEIAEVVGAYGFDVHRRPPDLASDTAGTRQVCTYVLDDLQKKGLTFDVLCCLYATAPLRTADDIRETLALLEQKDVHFAQAVTTYNLPAYQMMIEDAAGFLIHAWPLVAGKKSQEIPQAWIGNGSTYAAEVPLFRQYGFSGPGLKGYPMPLMRSVDIDTREQFELALCCAEWQRRKCHE